MPEFEIMVVCEATNVYTIEADSVEEAVDEAQDMLHFASDFELGDVTHVLVETPPGSRHFA